MAAPSTAPGSGRLRRLPALLAYGYLFFLAIEAGGRGMKASFATPLKSFLLDHAAEFTELRSFVIGVIGTALVQSSSTVTSMAVVMTQEGIVPLVIAIGIVHGANLGTSVTSSVVAFATATPQGERHPLRWLWALLTRPRGAAFERAVGTAVVHDFFNIILITSILLALELPLGLIHRASDALASMVEGGIAGSDRLLDLFTVVSPSTWTRPVVQGAMDLGAPAWVVAIGGLGLLFFALRGFATQMKGLILHNPGRTDDLDPLVVGERLLGRSQLDTFLRGLVLTVLVQSSSATTSLVVPLAALGFFRVRQIFPFILGANIGTTATALLAAAAGVGQPGFHEGLTIALSHVLLNTLAVILAATVPGLSGSIVGGARLLGFHAARRPYWLLVYLGAMAFGVPALVYVFPQSVAIGVLGLVMVAMVVVPHLAARRGGPLGLDGAELHAREEVA